MKLDVGLVEDPNEPPAPDTMLQAPVEGEGSFPASVTEVPQKEISGPAFASKGTGVNVTTTSSVDAAQGLFVTVHRKVYELPAIPVKFDVGEDAVVMFPPAPEMIDHEPVPTVGVFAASAVEVPQTEISDPAAAAVGGALKVTFTASVEGVHVVPFVTVH